jgi:hypothetical protein
MGLVKLAMFLTAGGATMNGCGGCDSGDFSHYSGYYGGDVASTLALVARLVGVWI